MAIDPWPSQTSRGKAAFAEYSATHHISHEDLAALISNKIDVAQRELILSHLAECSECRKLVAVVISSFSAVPDVPDAG
jgi:hypothetical protein